MRDRRLEVGHRQKRVRRRLEPDELDVVGRRPRLVELDVPEPPALELRERDARAEVRALGQRDRVPGGEERERERGRGAGAGGEEERMSTVELSERALGFDSGRVRITLVVELTGLAGPVGPDSRAVDGHDATLTSA